MCVHAHTVFTHVCFYTLVQAFIGTVATVFIYGFSLSYNATIVATLFYPYKAWAAHHAVAKLQKK